MCGQTLLYGTAFNVWYSEGVMLGALRQKVGPLGRFLAVFLLALQVFGQLGHYREHRTSAAQLRHLQHHGLARHTDIATPQLQHPCGLCTLSSSTATLLSPFCLALRSLVTEPVVPVFEEPFLLRSWAVRGAPPRGPPVS